MRWSTRASSCVLIESLQYSLSPGAATSRMANSLWNINTAHLKNKAAQQAEMNAERVSGGARGTGRNNRPLSLSPEEGPMQQKLEDKR